MVCIFLDGWEEKKKNSVTHEKHVKLKSQFLEIKFYWPRAPLTRLCIVCLLLHNNDGCDTDQMAYKAENTGCPTSAEEKVPTSDLNLTHIIPYNLLNTPAK